MSDTKKKIIEYSIGFALSIVGGYFVIYVQLNDLFSWPSYAYVMLSIFVGVLLLCFLLVFMRSLIINHWNSKQEHFMVLHPGVDNAPPGMYRVSAWTYAGLMWKVKISEDRKVFYDVHGPFCPKEECLTELRVRTTFFGRYKYECPACSFKQKSDYNSYTLERNFEKVTRARLERERAEKTRKEMEVIRGAAQKIKKAWDEV